MRFSWVDDVGRNEPIDVAVAFNPRRRTRMGISFDQDGTLLVDAPVGTTAADVRAVLEAHGRWLRYKARAAPDEAATWFPKVYEDGVILFYRGSALTLATERRRRVVAMDRRFAHPSRIRNRRSGIGTATSRARRCHAASRSFPTDCRGSMNRRPCEPAS